jgi:hypothetical protein
LYIKIFIFNEDLKNSQGRLISANVVFIMITTLLLILTYNTQLQASENYTNDTNKKSHIDEEFVILISTTSCQRIGYALYGAGMSMFYWMTVLCLDLFWTLSRTSPSNHHQRTSRLRFLCYALFGCGMPILQTVSIYILDNFETSHFDGFFKPGKRTITTFLYC